VLGSRHDVRIGASMLRRLVPDIAGRDVYVCGPESFDEQVTAAATRLGVSPASIHQERFSF